MKTKRKYLNPKHQEVMERTIAKLEKQKPIPAKEAAKQAFEMHEQLARKKQVAEWHKSPLSEEEMEKYTKMHT